MVQYAGVVALDQDLTAQVDAYRRKRDAVVAALAGLSTSPCPEGAFYAFPRAPWGTATEFVAEAIKHNLLIIPGNVFSRRDTHFRISYAVDDATLLRGLKSLRRAGAITVPDGQLLITTLSGGLGPAVPPAWPVRRFPPGCCGCGQPRERSRLSGRRPCAVAYG